MVIFLKKYKYLQSPPKYNTGTLVLVVTLLFPPHTPVLQMYVTLMFRAKGTRLTKPTLCLVLLSLAVLVGVIRVTEHRNHWNDVLAGFITGGAIAAFLVKMTCVCVRGFQGLTAGLKCAEINNQRRNMKVFTKNS